MFTEKLDMINDKLLTNSSICFILIFFKFFEFFKLILAEKFTFSQKLKYLDIFLLYF